MEGRLCLSSMTRMEKKIVEKDASRSLKKLCETSGKRCQLNRPSSTLSVDVVWKSPEWTSYCFKTLCGTAKKCAIEAPFSFRITTPCQEIPVPPSPDQDSSSEAKMVACTL